MRKLPFLFIALFLITSCKDKNKIPKDIFPKEKMQAVLWSMINAGEFLNGYVLYKDSVDNLAESLKAYGQVFQVHHITKEEFDKSYMYYREHPDLMKVILDSISKRQAKVVEKVLPMKDSTQKKILEPVEAK
jgi:Domain of unknown function (DUF4296)